MPLLCLRTPTLPQKPARPGWGSTSFRVEQEPVILGGHRGGPAPHQGTPAVPRPMSDPCLDGQKAADRAPSQLPTAQ